jgi:hypothetical protein
MFTVIVLNPDKIELRPSANSFVSIFLNTVLQRASAIHLFFNHCPALERLATVESSSLTAAHFPTLLPSFEATSARIACPQ